MWDFVVTLGISIILMGGVFGYPIYFVYNRYLNTKPKVNRPFREPCIFVNPFGHLQMIPVNEDRYGQIQQYFKQNPEKAKKLLDGLYNDEEW